MRDDARIMTDEQILDLQNPDRRKRLCQIRGLPENTSSETQMIFHEGRLVEVIITTRIKYP